MESRFPSLLYARLIAWLVLLYGLLSIAESLMRQLQIHGHHHIHELLLTLPVLFGLGYIYLGTLLLRLKRNAWLAGLALSAAVFIVNLSTFTDRYHDGMHLHPLESGMRLMLPALVFVMLSVNRNVFRVQSDRVGFRQALRITLAVLAAALLYGVAGFVLLDQHDFHQEISIVTALHQTIDQFGLTTASVVPHTARARLFMDSLSAVSAAAALSIVLAFFQPIRLRIKPQLRDRIRAEELLRQYPSDIDDFFKLWPHDKHYFFDAERKSGLAYHVSTGVALVVGDPFGDPERFAALGRIFQEFCFVNDWRAAFVHVGDHHLELYKDLGFRAQKIGEEAVLNLQTFAEHRNDKYFRQIRNRFTKLGYTTEVLEAPLDEHTLSDLAAISREWLERPGRAERGFMLGSYSSDYMQASRVVVARDADGTICGFMNLVPTYEPKTANYDLLRCRADAPGNSNDFLVLGAIDYLQADGCQTLNLGLCPLAGLDEAPETTTVIEKALQFIYANGDRFYSFSGLTRFKAKYHPDWENRYIVYSGGPAGFARAMGALTRAMRI
jgi:phosphatidylglycerol lysyltransferase